MSAQSYFDEPIIPGRSAGGILVGSLERDLPDFLVPRSPAGNLIGNSIWARFESDKLVVVTKDHVVDGIYVQNGYRGRFADFLGIGTTVLEIIRRYGPVSENQEDGLAIWSVPGLWYETEHCPIDSPEFIHAKVQAIGVYADEIVSKAGRVLPTFFTVYHHPLPEEAEAP